MDKSFFLLISAGFILLLTGCQQSSDTSDATELAKVGSEVLTIEEAADEIPDYMLREDSIFALQRYEQSWIRRQLILQEAQRLNISQNSDLQKRLQRLQDEVLIQGLKDYVLAKFDENLEITDEEARNYYQAHKDQLVLNERYVRFRHLEASSYEAAQSAKRELMQGIEWPEVARTHSANAEARIQESEKFWPISMAAADNNVMNTMLQRIGITEISPIQRVNGDYHFVQLMETRPAGDHPDLDWLMSQIKDWLRLEKRRRHFNSYVKNLYLNAESNNEIETYNVLESKLNEENSESDTLGTAENNE